MTGTADQSPAISAWPLKLTRTGAVRRVGWGIGDQALSSITNFAVGVVVARSVSIADFGAYALVFSAYCFVLGVARALSAEPFAVRFVLGEPKVLQQARAAVFGVALAVGLSFAFLTLTITPFLPATYRSLSSCLAFVLPGLMVQDVARQVLFTAGRGLSAFSNDLLWAALMIPAFTAAFLLGSVSAATLVLAWGAAATVAGVIGCRQCAVVPSIRTVMQWLRSERALWPRYLVEGSAINGSQQITYFAVGAISGLAAAGEMKLVLVLLGPVNVLVQGIGVVAVPEAARALAAGSRTFVRVMAVFSISVSSGALIWGLTVSMLPTNWGAAVVGQGWLTAAVLVVPLFLAQVFNGGKTGASVGLRALGAARRSMWTRLVASLLAVACSVFGAAYAGVQGAAWGLALAAAGSALLWHTQFGRLLISRRRGEEVGPTYRQPARRTQSGIRGSDGE